jgi:hypothetical protein
MTLLINTERRGNTTYNVQLKRELPNDGLSSTRIRSHGRPRQRTNLKNRNSPWGLMFCGDGGGGGGGSRRRIGWKEKDNIHKRFAYIAK